METAIKHKKILFFILVIISLKCSTDSDLANQPPRSFEIQVSEISTTSVQLVWSASIDPDNSTVFYDIYLQNEKLADNITELSFDLNDLEEAVIYSGKIIASDPQGNETSIPFNFEISVNQKPTAFTTTVATKNPFRSNLNWTKSYDPEGEVILYNVYLNDSLVDDDINSTTYTLRNLKGLTSYSGYVEAVDSDGKTYKSHFSFLTDIKVYDNSISFENQAQVEAFGKLGYNIIEESLIIGSFNVQLNNISDLSYLSTLREVGSNIYIQNTSCKNLKGLEGITETSIYGELTIKNNNELLTLEGLEGITEMPKIYISGNRNLLNFNGLDNLKTVTNYLSAPYNESLVSIEGLKNLTNIKELNITNNDALRTLKGLEKIITMDELHINSNDNLQSLEGLNNLEYCRAVSISDNAALPNLKGLNKLSSIASLYLSGNSDMTNLTGLDALTQATSSITIQYHKNLETLEGLNNFVFSGGNSFGYSLGIYNNSKLINLDALKNCRFLDQNGHFQIRSNSELVDFCGITQLTKDMDTSATSIYQFFRWNKFDPTYSGILNGECSQ